MDETPKQRNALHSRNVTGTQFPARFAAAAMSVVVVTAAHTHAHTHTHIVLQPECIFSLVNTKAYLLFLAQVACIKFDKFQTQSPC